MPSGVLTSAEYSDKTGNTDNVDLWKKVIPQRCRISKRIQQEGESISEYLRELKHLAIIYNFGDICWEPCCETVLWLGSSRKACKKATTKERRCHPG
ncbi:hypothetical protein LAZ67_10002034 [Cordylochernes scorpioides]|uniref:Retrotransposon gag domain-containing protein n=1 Tax=Cordylochernes scorpioides TaxID=51811 RepID=A0ABY6KX07_9ARAC|nr:hypothetical protein LAZ67_10002034 [Cordylochernes scorpioides]